MIIVLMSVICVVLIVCNLELAKISSNSPTMLNTKATALLCFDLEETATIKVPIARAISIGIIGRRFMSNKLYNCILNKSLYFLAIFNNLHKNVFKAMLTFYFLHCSTRNQFSVVDNRNSIT